MQMSASFGYTFLYSSNRRFTPWQICSAERHLDLSATMQLMRKDNSHTQTSTTIYSHVLIRTGE